MSLKFVVIFLAFLVSSDLLNGSPVDVNLFEEDNSRTTSELTERNKRAVDKVNGDKGSSQPQEGKVCSLPDKLPDQLDIVDSSGTSAGQIKLNFVNPLANAVKDAHKKADENADELKTHKITLNTHDVTLEKHGKEIKDIWDSLAARIKEAGDHQEKTNKLQHELASAERALSSLGNSHDELKAAHKQTNADLGQQKEKLAKEVADRKGAIASVTEEIGGVKRALNTELEKLKKVIEAEEVKRSDLENKVTANKGDSDKAHAALSKELEAKGKLIDLLLDAEAKAKAMRNDMQASLLNLWNRVELMDSEYKTRFKNLEQENLNLKQEIADVRSEIYEELGEIFFNGFSKLKQLSGNRPSGNPKGKQAEEPAGSQIDIEVRLNDFIHTKKAERLLIQAVNLPNGREGAMNLEALNDKSWLKKICESALRRVVTFFVCIFSWNCWNKKEAITAAVTITQEHQHNHATDDELMFVVAQGVMGQNLVKSGNRTYILRQD